ncbi:MAG: ester cyclase [Chloroflexales bacterium]|nr:ester cyclase [Chloroflexales bacterium]
MPAFQPWPPRVPGTLSHGVDVPAARQQANKAAVRELLDALSRGTFGAAVVAAGPGELSDRFVELRRAFPDLSLTPLVQITEGDLVVTRAELRGTHLGPLYGIPATGKTLRWEFFCLMHVADGVIVAQQSSPDWNDALAQLGLLAM